MCGIAGAIGALNDELQRVVAVMSGAQVHRGPDSGGIWTSPACSDGRGACFAFRRLAILDLTSDGDQPMRDEATGNVIVFNGEIYNHAEIRRELEAAGDVLRSRSDTEVLLRAYGRWGEACLDKLRGMFAFAIHDARRRVVVLARDRLGIKPLYYTQVDTPRGSALLFASELRSLLASGSIARQLDRSALSTYLWNGFVLGSQSIVAGVRELEAGCVATIDLARPDVVARRYWRLPQARASAGTPSELRATLLETVRQHLMSDVPVGVFLSGGIDSSAIASLAVRSGASDVRTFNVAFDEAQFDESKHARAVAQALGTRHEEIRLDERAFADGLDDALGALDQPSFDALNTWFVSRAVRRAGVTVALAGTGGDELFGGYKSFRDLPRARRAQRLSSALPQSLVRRAARSLAHTGARGPRNAEVPPQTRWGKLDDLLATDGSWVELYQVSYALYTRAFLERIAPELGDLHSRYGIEPELRTQLESWIERAPELHAISMLELHMFLGQRLLRDTDAASMAVSLEVRVPLVDHRVVEVVAALDERTRFEPLGTKRCLREIGLEGLDPALFERPKSGFVLPIERWCRAHLSQRIAATFADRHACAAAGLESKALTQLFDAYLAGAPGLYWSRVWAPFALISWCQRHKVSL